LESLEDRLTPSISLSFFPIADVAVNPQPLPPGSPPQVRVEFDPLLSGSIGSNEIVVTKDGDFGVLSKVITLPAPAAGVPGQTWSLETFYHLTTSATLEVVAPNASGFGDGSVRGFFKVAGTTTEILAPVAPTTGATWVFNGTISGQGTVDDAVSLSPGDR
jgi:hypothetical protein